MAGPLPINRLTIPLFSSDYAKLEREIAEWNRRARAASLSLDAQIEDLQIQIDSLSSQVGGIGTVGRATSTVYGIVITDETSTTPTVYLTSSVDALIAGLQAQIDALDVRVSTLETNQTPQRGDGPPDAQAVVPVGRYDGDEYWDMLAGPGTYRWNLATAEWFSM